MSAARNAVELPDDERQLLAGYSRLIGGIEETKVYCVNALRPLLTDCRAEVSEYPDSGPSDDSGDVKEWAKRYVDETERIRVANKHLAKRELITLVHHQHEPDVVVIGLELAGYDLGREFANVKSEQPHVPQGNASEETTMSEQPAWSYEPVPSAAQRLFRMAWQLETWLRTIVYVELRAARVDWEEPIKSKVRNWPPASKQSDKKLHHMATPHQAALSYLTFGELWAVISDAKHWPQFEPYFPPKDNTFVRIDEVKAIRNRVAHFREPHPQDVARMELFMRDMEPGVRNFCERYCKGKGAKASDDEVSEKLKTVWEQVGYGIEMKLPSDWLYAPGEHRRQPLMNARLERLTHKNYSPGHLSGVIYKLTLSSRKKFDTVGFVESTSQIHKDIIHILLASDYEPSITIPAIHGVETTVQLISQFLSAGLNNHLTYIPRNLDRAKLKWPEHILWPNHLLSFFSDEMSESVLDLS